MKLLLDTHIFLWFITADLHLPTLFRDAIRDPQNEAFLSVASLWEVITKYNLGKLPLPQPPEIYIPNKRTSSASNQKSFAARKRGQRTGEFARIAPRSV